MTYTIYTTRCAIITSTVIIGNATFVSDLRSGAFSGGGGEQAVLAAASAQMSNFYGIPSGVLAGMSDSKLPDNQAGYEKAITDLLAGFAGANFVYESAGMLAGLLGCSFEAMAVDDEMISNIRRAMRGIEVTDDTLSVEVIEQVARGHQDVGGLTDLGRHGMDFP